MDSRLLGFVLVCSAIPWVAGLKCYMCTSTHVETDVSDVQSLFKQNDTCSDSQFDKNAATMLECAAGLPNVPAKCMKSIVMATFSAAGVEITSTTVTRYCSSDDGQTDRCTTSTDPSTFNSQLPPSLSIDSDSFRSTTCLCSHDNCNGQTTLAPTIVTCLASLFLAMVCNLW